MKRFIDDYYYPSDDDPGPAEPKPTRADRVAATARFVAVCTLNSLALCAATFPIGWITFHYHTPVNPWFYPAAVVGVGYLLYRWSQL